MQEWYRREVLQGDTFQCRRCIGEKSHEGYLPVQEVHRREDLRADAAKQEWPLNGEKM